ncbi:type II secretion system minor pseudopilin GspI [Pseudomaricurvus sp. HS19]|uniref:type II secretion system minor pseudopilin GspI n=1 Tax=Pseudomaricurvus sp. HS19 TaxID=2692626 RepID=UPI00136F551F|nr:type II secretion system minor pseudopilin GspI [Pseudomaricurvus sp. HS19]MYM62969.1 type II secretion system minor pseudopilin GspI [Pseudomaricurvus sp. HS19]
MNAARHRGFTLLEVMVALTIFAVCAAVLLQQSGRSAQQAARLETHTVALWLAGNQLELLRLDGDLPAPGNQEQQVEYGQQTWLVSQEVSNTSNPDLRQVTVSVRPLAAEKGGTRLSTFVGRY